MTPPSQAGRFKPRKAAPKKATASSSAASLTSVSASVSAGRAASSGRGADIGGRGRGRGRGENDGARADRRGSGGSAGRGGRGARGRGRGRGRGRVPLAQGKVFFTGSATGQEQGKASSSSAAVAGARPRGKGGIILPGGGGSSGGGRSSFTNPGEKTPQQEGEEMIVGEISGGGVGSAAIARAAAGGGDRVLERETKMMPSMFDDEEENKEPQPASAFTYDSSSDEDEGSRKRRLAKKTQARFRGQMPTQLPFPLAPGTTVMKEEEEEKSNKASMVPVMDQDPLLVSPFAKLALESNIDGKVPHPKWMLFKLPTRLPRVDPSSMGGASNLAVPELAAADGEEMVPDVATSGGVEPATSNMDVSAATAADPSAIGQPASSGADGTLYDDTLKDVAPGRYGKLKVYKSGRTELIVGSDSHPSRQVTMQVMEGVQPSFYQQTVVIDPNTLKFVPLGDVKRSVVVIPDVERVFGGS
jgi:hypothetical protein